MEKSLKSAYALIAGVVISSLILLGDCRSSCLEKIISTSAPSKIASINAGKPLDSSAYSKFFPVENILKQNTPTPRRKKKKKIIRFTPTPTPTPFHKSTLPSNQMPNYLRTKPTPKPNPRSNLPSNQMPDYLRSKPTPTPNLGDLARKKIERIKRIFITLDDLRGYVNFEELRPVLAYGNQKTPEDATIVYWANLYFKRNVQNLFSKNTNPFERDKFISETKERLKRGKIKIPAFRVRGRYEDFVCVEVDHSSSDLPGMCFVKEGGNLKININHSRKVRFYEEDRIEITFHSLLKEQIKKDISRKNRGKILEFSKKDKYGWIIFPREALK